MAEFYTSGRVIDLILVLMVLETVLLIRYWRRRSGGVPPLVAILNLASGGSLLLAVRCALTGAPWYWVGFFLGTAGLAHLADLWQRWKSPVHGSIVPPNSADAPTRNDCRDD